MRIQTGAEVVAISTDPAGGQVTGVELADGQQLAASVVVCNRDLAAAYPLLEGGNSSGGTAADGSSSTDGRAAPSPAVAAYARQQHERLGRLKYSAGVIGYNWCVDRELAGLAHHNVFLSEEWVQSWRPATQPKEFPHSPNFYVHAPSRTDGSAAPPGCDSIMVLLPVANQQQCGSDYSSLVAAGRERILQVSWQHVGEACGWCCMFRSRCERVDVGVATRGCCHRRHGPHHFSSCLPKCTADLC